MQKVLRSVILLFGRYRGVLLRLCLCLMILATYASSLSNDFVSYDDPLYVTQNPHVRDGLTWLDMRWAFEQTGGTGNYHPITWLSHMLDCELYQLKPIGHHLTNILCHITNCLLLFWLFEKLTSATWRSFHLAALFGLHPIHVESVAWISERKDVLSTLFFLVTLLAYVHYAQTQPGCFNNYFLALFFFVLGCLSKAMVVSIPFVLLLLDWWPLNRTGRVAICLRVMEKLPFVVCSTATSIITLFTQKNAGELSMLQLPFTVRCDNAAVSLIRYVAKLLWPVNLAVFYPYPDHWPLFLSVCAWLFISFASFCAVVLRQRLPYIAFGWLWFIITVMPVIGIVQAGAQSIADRYMYLPSVGIFLMLIWGFHELLEKRPERSVVWGFTSCSVLLVCSLLSLRQLTFWKSSVTLFSHAAVVTQENWRTLNNLGTALLNQKRFEDAYKALKRASLLEPHEPSIRCNLATILIHEERLDEALVELKTALTERPKDVPTRINLANLLISKARFAEATEELQDTLLLAPSNSTAYSALGTALLGSRRFDEALTRYRRALELKPNDLVTMNNLGVALMRCERLSEAITNFQECIRLDPKSSQAYRNLGEALGRQGFYSDAAEQYQKAIQLAPKVAEYHFGLAMALLCLQRPDEAIEELRNALRLRPHYSPAEQALFYLSQRPKP